MFRPASRTLLRRQCVSAPLRPTLLKTAHNRTLFTSAAAPKRSSFKSFAIRWGLAGALVYFCATSAVFADEVTFRADEPPDKVPGDEDRPASLLGSRLSSRKPGRTGEEAGGRDSVKSLAVAKPKPEGEATLAEPQSPEELEEEADQQGAFNPETGEINWDCPCLGGMAHGPCGEEFKTAFSCFIYSSEEPKGVDCIDKFKGMQSCFQKYPEVYDTALSEDDDDEEDIDEKPDAFDTGDSEETRASAKPSKLESKTHVAVGPGTESEAKPKPQTKTVDALDTENSEETRAPTKSSKMESKTHVAAKPDTESESKPKPQAETVEDVKK